jgi:hypothetical protein
MTYAMGAKANAITPATRPIKLLIEALPSEHPGPGFEPARDCAAVSAESKLPKCSCSVAIELTRPMLLAISYLPPGAIR